MKKSVIGLTVGLLALLMLSRAAWAASVNENYPADEDVQNTPYAPQDGGAAEGQLWDFAGAWGLAAAEGGVVTLQQDVLAAAEDAPEGIFVQVPEDGQVTLNLNGHRLAGEDVPCLIYVGARGRLTVTDGGQSGGQIVGVVSVDDGADDPNEWGQLELLGDVEVVDPNVMLTTGEQAVYMKGGNTQRGTFAEMWTKAATSGGTVTLLANVTAVDGSFGSGTGFDANGGILVPDGKQITLDLNGYTLNRGLTSAKADGYVIQVLGSGSSNYTLFIIDDTSTTKNGLITGGYNASNGGGIVVKGRMYANAGRIAGNKTDGSGGGIYVWGQGILSFQGASLCDNTAQKSGGGIYAAFAYQKGKLNVSSGTISGNHTGGHGGGVYSSCEYYSDVKFSGTVQIIGNKRTPSSGSETTDNVWIEQECPISLGTLSGSAKIGIGSIVYSDNAEHVIVTDGATSENFQHLFADNSGNHLVLNEAKNKISLVKGPGPHEHNSIAFTALSTITSPLSSGSYYLTGNIALSDTVTISGDDVSLCLNGYTITGPTGKPAFQVSSGAALNVYNAEGTNFAGLSGSGGIEVAGGGTLNLMARDGSAEKTYQPDANTTGGTVTVDSSGAVTTPGGGSGEDPTPAGPHEHNSIAFTALSTITSPLSSGSYYLTGDITLSDTVTISGIVNLCLNGHTITGPTGKPAFQVPNGAKLNVYNAEGTNFAGLSGSGGIEVAGGGTLNLIAKDGSTAETYNPNTGTSGGTVTVSQDGTVTKPDGGGDDPAPGTGDHKVDHPDPTGSFKVISADNFNTVTQENPPTGYQGVLPEVTTAYRFLNPGEYYLENNFKMPYALIALGNTDFCLYGSNLGADNDTWIYELQHVFWVPEKTALNVLDCQRDLHIVWLYGGRVFLKNGARVNISGKIPDYITTIEMDEDAEGEVQVKYVNREPVMTLPRGATLTQKAPGGSVQTIKNRNGVLEVTPPGASKPIQITPPSASAPINLKLPETVPGEETPDIVLEAPAGSTVQTADGPEIRLEQPGEVASDGTVSSPKVTVTTVDPATHEEVKATVTAPSGQDVQANPDGGTVEAPVGSTVTTGGETVKIEEIRPAGGGAAGDAVTILPGGQIELPAGGEVALSTPKRGSVTIVIALPGGGAAPGTPGTIDITDTGFTPPKGSTVTVKPKRESVTIVIALPYPEDGGEPPEIHFSDNGALILPEGTEVTTRNGDQETKTIVTEDAPYLNPETGELTETDPEAPIQPSEPVHPNEPTGKTEVITPDAPIEKPDVKVEMDDKGEITVTPADPEKPAVVIKPQPGETPTKPPVVDETGKVFIDAPFKVETEDGPDITAEKGGSVDPDGNVTGETVTVEQKKPDGTTESTTLTAPENDAVKVGPNGEAQAPVGTEVKRDDVTVKIDNVPDPAKPVAVKPDGSLDLPGGSQITITPKPDQPDQKYTVTIPADKGGEVKPNPDGKITLPPGAEVTGPDGKKTTISDNGGAIDPSTGEITGAAPSGGGSVGPIGGGGPSGGSSSASYVIIASASIGGKISPDNRVTVRRGADQTFTIKPDEGYVISDVLVDSESVGAVDSYTFRNVRRGHTIQALFVAEGMSGHGHQGDCPRDETCPIWPYTDSIPTDWYHDGVHYCIENDLMIGTAPVLWEPDIPLSRAMMAQVLYNKAGQPAVSGDGVFDDVDQEWYWPAITWGGRSNVLRGYDDGSFGPQDPITREQLATLLWRYAGQPQSDGEVRFSDAAQVSDYAKQALHWASRLGVIAGYPDGTFRPQDNASRAEAAQMIMRYFNL